MQCLILAGGLGTRMKAVSGDLPKALLPAGPQAFIDWQLQWLARLGVTHVVMAIGHEGKRIEEHLKGQSARHPGKYPILEFRFDGLGELLGTGGAVKNCADLLEDDFLVTYGDSFLFVDARKLFDTHRKSGRGVTFSIFHNQGRGDTSNVIYREGRIIRYDKLKLVPEMDYIDYGMMALKKSYFLAKTPEGKFDLAPFLTHASEEGQMTPYLAREIFREIGSPSGYAGFQELLARYDHDLAKLEELLS